MFERFRKKSSTKNETTADVAATLAELEVEVEAEVVASGDEIEQARQDLMRAAMEAITIPAPEAESETAAFVPPKSDDANIPVIQVRVTSPAPPIPKPQSKPTAPPQAAEPSAKMEPLAPSEPTESPPSPVEPTIDEQKTPESVEEETAADESPEMVPLRTEPLVVEQEPPEIKETTGPDEPRIAQLDDIMIDIIKQDIASHRRQISRSD